MTGDARKWLVIAETAEGRPAGVVYEALGLARRLAGEPSGNVEACIVGGARPDTANDLIRHGADRVYALDSPGGGTEAWVADVVALIRESRPDAVSIGHTALGAELAPRLAFRLDSAVVTSCVDARFANGRLQLTRPCYGGKAREVVSIRTAPAIFTIKPKSFEPCVADEARRGEVVARASVLDRSALRTKVREVRRNPDEDTSLESAQVVVAGGGGMKGPQGFELARRIADLLRGAVGASRVACDLGWCPPSYQVGLSGKTIAPQLYIAIGISGAGQHMAGCGNARNIVAINSDRDAPIFRFARYGVVGDCHELMPALIERLEARTATRSTAAEPDAAPGSSE
jgi:electron transfer flavoprotein alpha subunit